MKNDADWQIDWSKEPDLARLNHIYTLFKVDVRAAIEELKLLAQKGSLASMMYLGQLYRFGGRIDALEWPKPRHFVATDLHESEYWFRQAAKTGNIVAHYHLGRTLLKLRKYDEAKAALEFGVDRNFAPAIHMLGRMHLTGRGVEKNKEKARKLFERAAADGNILAKLSMARSFADAHESFPTRVRGRWLSLKALCEAVASYWSDGFPNNRLR